MNPGPWRIVFFGTPAFAVPVLEGLLDGTDPVRAVVTQPDRRKGRGQRVGVSAVKERFLHDPYPGCCLLQPEKVKETSFQETLRGLCPDLFVVAAFGQILPAAVLEIPRYGSINVHASLLPKYRGAAPIPWAILRGEEVTGVTIMKMDAGMDTGDILLQRDIPIRPDETAETLHDRLALLGPALLLETLHLMKKQAIAPLPQDAARATYAPPLKKEDGRIDWSREAIEIDRQVRAFHPWPVAFTHLRGQMLKVYRGEAKTGGTGERGGKVAWVGNDWIEVETGKGVYRIREVQLEGKRRMTIREFLSGHPVPVGMGFE